MFRILKKGLYLIVMFPAFLIAELCELISILLLIISSVSLDISKLLGKFNSFIKENFFKEFLQ